MLMKHSISGSGSDSVTVMRRIHYSVRCCVAATESGLSGMYVGAARPALLSMGTPTESHHQSVSHQTHLWILY